MLYIKVVRRVNTKSYHHKGKNVFYFVSVGGDGCSLNLLW